MNNKRILFFILIRFIIIIITIGIGINRWGDFKKNDIEDVESIEKQLEHLQNLQMEVDSIIMKDDKVQELIEEKNHLKMLEIIHNESCVVDLYWIGFEYDYISYSKEFQMIGGKFYRFSVDLSNKTVLSVKEVKNQTTYIIEIKDELFMENAYTSTYSLASIDFSNIWHPLSQWWVYDNKISGIGEVKLIPDASIKTKGWGCHKHYVTIEKVYNKEYFYFSVRENNPGSKKAWYSGDELSYIDSINSGELLRCTASYPRELNESHNWPSDIGFYYYWELWSKPNKTIVFDVTVKFLMVYKV